ncbi:unnamed protein product [Rhizoctonia solani]|uniref:Uncharacterized protein n=1 Tax=Rhizoctonia solani TaxID=456999 RepID=A0A8H2XX92_9AGAM|nr:unnamed protein product [Rhizoctonia solani]
MFSTITNMLPNLSLQADKDSPTPMGNTINPFDKFMAVKRKLEGARTTHMVDVEPEPEEEQDDKRETERKERRKQKPLNETFVVVRPPPSVSNHPLNLQLQLIPPTIQQTNHVPRSASTSTTASTSSAGGERSYAAAGGVPNVPPISAGLQGKKEAQRQQTSDSQADDELLNRRANRSDLSLFYSSMGSSASVTSFSTVASTNTSGGTRRIIPLYNLSAHNVLQNTVQDAGTDATVSRFRKRGIDIVGLGLLEPIEVHGSVPVGGTAGYTNASSPPDIEGASDAGHGSIMGHSAGGSNLGHDDSDQSPPAQSIHIREPSAQAGYFRDQPSRPNLRDRPSQSHLKGRISPSPPSQLREVSTPPEEVPKESAGKRFFGKLFKKKDSSTPATPTSPSLLSPTMTPRGSIAANRNSMLVPPPAPSARPISVHSARPTSVYSVGPTSPSTVSPATPTQASAQAAMYLQPPVLGTQATLRCDTFPPVGRPAAYVWVLRKWTKGGGMFSGIVGTGGVDLLRVGVEVRFEWVRGKKKRVERGEYVPTPGRPVSVVSLGEGDNLGIPEAGSMRSVSPDARSRRGSRPRSDSKRSQSPTKPRVQPSSGSDDGDESDPEDSETPWSCTLRVLPLDTASSQEPLKLRLAHLVPAPHHPKVIGQFKMPFPLPDVHVQNLELVPRSVNDPFGMGEGKADGGMIMSAEEIKDVVCTTGLWLMVREGFGGLSGKKRKGDGWKIRS